MGKLWHFAISVIVLSIVTSISFVFLPWKVEFIHTHYVQTTSAAAKRGYDLSFMHEWLNVVDLNEEDIVGHPVLIVFFNFTDVDSLNALEHIEDWYQKYSDDGLVVIGVHSPILDFENDLSHLRNGIDELGLSFPITRDFNWNNWHRYRVKGLPAWYLFDQSGEMEFQAFGALNPQQLQTRIAHSVRRYQKFLPFKLKPPPLHVQSLKKGIKTLYAGFKNNTLGQIVADQDTAENGVIVFKDPGNYAKDKIYLNGQWKLTDDTLTPSSLENSPYVAIKYNGAQKVYAVMGSDNDENVRVLITLDGKPIPKEKSGPQITYDNSGRSFLQIYQPKNYLLIDSFELDDAVIKLFPLATDWNLYEVSLEQ